MEDERNGASSGEAELARRRYRLTLEYDGTGFFGWQLQPDKRTVQGVLEEALGRLFGDSVRITGAGRTDTGVSALGQVAHFDAPVRFEPEVIKKALNYFLSPDVRVSQVRPVSSDFHARYSARWRWYRYRVFTFERAIERQHGWWPRFKFDTKCLQKAAFALVGEHDFTPFSSVDSETENRLCHVFIARWELVDDEWRFHIIADRFLRHMVRSLVGTMLDTARGRFSLHQFGEILQSRHKSHDVFTAPPGGLCLMRVGYGPFPALEEDSKIIQSFPFDINSTNT